MARHGAFENYNLHEMPTKGAHTNRTINIGHSM
jgi:hypothetical protein